MIEWVRGPRYQQRSVRGESKMFCERDAVGHEIYQSNTIHTSLKVWKRILLDLSREIHSYKMDLDGLNGSATENRFELYRQGQLWHDATKLASHKVSPFTRPLSTTSLVALSLASTFYESNTSETLLSVQNLLIERRLCVANGT